MVSFFKYRHKNHNGGIIVNLLLHKNAVIINYLSRSCMEQMYECRGPDGRQNFGHEHEQYINILVRINNTWYQMILNYTHPYIYIYMHLLSIQHHEGVE